MVQKIGTKYNYSTKILRIERIIGQNLSKYTLAERNAFSLCEHSFIVKLSYPFQTSTKLLLIRVLKPENYVFVSERHCKLNDFDLSKESKDNNRCTKVIIK